MNELRKRIAELKGYRPLNKTALDDTLTPVNLWRYEGERICDEDIPAWDEDIAAAFELVEEMAEKSGCGIEISRINERSTTRKLPKYCVIIYGGRLAHDMPDLETSFMGDNPAAVICKAYIKHDEMHKEWWKYQETQP
jgi:hypothetical protein